MKRLFVLIGFSILATACSNPFSSQKSSVLQENPKPFNQSCNGVRFDQSELTAKQFREVIHCLNQSQDLKEIEAWSLNISDQELEPLIEQFNSLLKNEPQFLYALKETYFEEKKNSKLQSLISNLFSKIHSLDQKNNLIHLIRYHSPWIRDFFTSPLYRINTGNISLLADVRAFKRGVKEQYDSGNLKSIVQNISEYHQQPDSISFQNLFNLFSNTSTSLMADKLTAEKVAGFMNWLLEDDKIKVFSLAAESLSTKPIKCFNDNNSVQKPLDTLLLELRDINPDELPAFIKKKIPSVLLLGQGYCNIPSVVISAAKLLQKSTEQENLITFFTFIQPLLKDNLFVELLASKAFRDLNHGLAKENDTHFFQDLITLINWLQKNPISEINTAQLFDSVFNEFNPDDILFFIDHLPSDQRSFETIHEIIESLPKLLKTKSISNSIDWFSPFTKDSFISVVDLLDKMSRENKIIPIVDRIMDLFQAMLDRGKSSYLKQPLSDLTNSKSTNSQTWELSFWYNKDTTRGTVFNCANIKLDSNFFITSVQSKDDYLKNLNDLGYCFGSNQSFLGLQGLASYLIHKDPDFKTFNQFNSLQDGLIDFVFSLNTKETFNAFDQIIRFNQNDLHHVHRIFQAGSVLLSSSRNSLPAAHETRKLIAKYASKKETYSALTAHSEENNKISEVDPDKLRLKLLNLTVSELPRLFKTYCPDLNNSSSSCDLEADQVLLYVSSPQHLAEKIVDEFLSSSQSWIHPLEFSHWLISDSSPNEVSTLEFHLNPLLKQFGNNPKAINSVFNFIKRNEKSDYKLISFLKDKANTFSVIPYIFQTANYPNTPREYHQLIRIRVVTDLDRLELLAINSDFKPFGLMRNFGMNFIREIATSWGDVADADRPQRGTSETLGMARVSILNEFSKFDRNIIQRIGSCDPRGRNRMGNWILNKFCKGDLSDVRARMLNLKSMLSILDDPHEMTLLRDLFYSLYENNTVEQEGVYTNGIKDSINGGNEDLLETIPKISRLGLIHQTALSIINGRNTGIDSIISILNQSNIENQNEKISKDLSTDSGQTFAKSLILFSMSLSANESKNISTLLQVLSSITNQEWLSFVLKIKTMNPDLITAFSPALHASLRRFDFSMSTPEENSLMSSISSELKNDKLIIETSRLLNDLTPFQKELVNLIDSKLSTNMADPWLRLLALDGNQKQRDQISSFIVGKGFEDFCDVFSDATISEKTYTFLDSSNQNSGVFELLDECRRFLH